MNCLRIRGVGLLWQACFFPAIMDTLGAAGNGRFGRRKRFDRCDNLPEAEDNLFLFPIGAVYDEKRI